MEPERQRMETKKGRDGKEVKEFQFSHVMFQRSPRTAGRCRLRRKKKETGNGKMCFKSFTKNRASSQTTNIIITST